MPGAEGSIREVEGLLADQLGRRERLLKDSRDVISSCSRAIISVHNDRMKEAAVELRKAKTMLKSLRRAAEGGLSRYLIPPETEFVEASAVCALATGGPLPGRATLDASPEAYLLGLLDTVGELKRLVLDSVKDGKMDDASRYFRSMEQIYSLCSPLAVYDHVAGGARRKIDVARMLVEDVRGLMTEEMRRESVIASMRRLQKRLDREKA